MCVDFDGEILVPAGDVGDFAVIACDQFSSAPEYWNKLEREMPSGSALEFILPECYLAESKTRIASIKCAARRLADGGRFYEVKGAVAVTRTTKFGRVRRGLVASVDLGAYDYKPNNSALIRASERTIESRIPPRVAIREASPVELPHIMLLVDDRENILMSAVDNSERTALYDSALRGGGGRIKGELIPAGKTAALYKAVDELIKTTSAKYGTPLFALVGDGNHSLATAKYCREHAPTTRNGRTLVEIVNIYDSGLLFESIHRFVKTDEKEKFIDGFRAALRGSARTKIYAPEPIEISVPENKVEAIETIDGFCEDFTARFGGEVDYVHGIDGLKRGGCVGIEMRCVEKSELFKYVIENGVLPKKTFSLGEAEEKRFYVEARRID